MNYETITSEESAAKVHGRNINALTPESLTAIGVDPKFQDRLIADYKLMVVNEALNTDLEGKIWEPNYTNYNEVKYTPYFEVEANAEHPGGVGFSASRYDYWLTATTVGARLCLKDSERVYHSQKYFKHLHLDHQLIRTK